MMSFIYSIDVSFQGRTIRCKYCNIWSLSQDRVCKASISAVDQDDLDRRNIDVVSMLRGNQLHIPALAERV